MQIFRRRERRMLGGVCAGLPKIWGLGTNGLRLAFVLLALLGGIGIVIYSACWLVIPISDADVNAEAARSVVVFAWAAGGLIVVVLIASVSAVAAAFGFGWLVFAIAAVMLVLATLVVGHTALPVPVILIAFAAFTFPATAVALSQISLKPQSGATVVRPASAAQLTNTTYASGLGTLMIDLRNTRLPSSGGLTMRINAGLRRTIVALPSSRCVRVRVNYKVHGLISNLVALLTARSSGPFFGVVLFGRTYGVGDGNAQGQAISRGTGLGPTLTIDFSSQGGSLFVRDYPDAVEPSDSPNWPGFVVTAEPRIDFNQPPFKSESRRLKALQLRSWRRRHQAQVASEHAINELMAGPCDR